MASPTGASGFRSHLNPDGDPRFAGIADLDAYSYADEMCRRPMVGDAIKGWLDEFENTVFRGITTDGVARSEVFGSGGNENAPSTAAVEAARRLLTVLDEDERAALVHPLDSKVWRGWMNPEFYVNRYGLRLEEVSDPARSAVLDLVRASLSERGYRTVRDLMRTNAFLGELVALPRILNEYSYNVNLFGTPSDDGVWGWNLYGHHLCLNCVFVGVQQVLTPVFFGAEPNEIDAGEHRGTVFGADRERAGLQFIRALPPVLADEAILYRRKRDPAMAPGRLHPGDELHLGGAFQDNRVIPYEGVSVGRCSPLLQEQLLSLVELFLGYQPAGPRAARLSDVRDSLGDTWFCWIGGTGDDDVFYYRIQSPVIMVEFDHHAGIFLSNTEPQRFHIHTLVRTPNGNDYGAELIRRVIGQPQLLDGPP